MDPAARNLIGQPFDDRNISGGASQRRALRATPRLMATNSPDRLAQIMVRSTPPWWRLRRHGSRRCQEADPGNKAPIPVDLVTASGSGLDPHMSPAAAAYQVGRVARARGLSEGAVRQLVDQHTEGRTLGLVGRTTCERPGVNLALDACE